jgi:hypothetical protein
LERTQSFVTGRTSTCYLLDKLFGFPDSLLDFLRSPLDNALGFPNGLLPRDDACRLGRQERVAQTVRGPRGGLPL